MRPLLLLEMNEIPWSVAERLRFPATLTRTTVSEDTGELSPWVTWPSLHRGMNNTEHGIKHLGQDVRTFRGEPIWETYRKHGHGIGVCGAMQSWPPIDPGPGGFYVPDTFAHDSHCIPRWVEPLQRFNLGQVKKSGRAVGGFGVRDALQALPLARYLRPRTLARAARQLVDERMDAGARRARPAFQTLLFWDVFRRLYNPGLMYQSFFTNHVANLMHRYWGEWERGWPEPGTASRLARPTAVPHALALCQEMIDDALAWQRRTPDLIVGIASSMGQGPVTREHLGYELVVNDLDKLVRAFTQAPYKPLLAMVPQVAVEMEQRAELKEGLQGTGFFSVDEVGSSLSITVHTRPIDDARLVRWGLRRLKVEAGTGYHVPEGVLLLAGRDLPRENQRARMPLRDVKALLWSLANR